MSGRSGDSMRTSTAEWTHRLRHIEGRFRFFVPPRIIEHLLHRTSESEGGKAADAYEEQGANACT